MRFPMPHHPCDCEIPDDWLVEGGVIEFASEDDAYRSVGNAPLVALTEIEPPA